MKTVELLFGFFHVRVIDLVLRPQRPEVKTSWWLFARKPSFGYLLPKVAITVVRDIECKQALQITSNDYEVDNNDIERAHGIYTGKFGPKEYDLEGMKRHDPKGRVYWVFKPTSISLWDEVNFPNSPKQKYL